MEENVDRRACQMFRSRTALFMDRESLQSVRFEEASVRGECDSMTAEFKDELVLASAPGSLVGVTVGFQVEFMDGLAVRSAVGLAVEWASRSVVELLDKLAVVSAAGCAVEMAVGINIG